MGEVNYTHRVVGSQPLDVIQSHIDAHHAQDQLVLGAEAGVCSGLNSLGGGHLAQLLTPMTSSCSHKWPPRSGLQPPDLPLSQTCYGHTQPSQASPSFPQGHPVSG